MTQQSEVHPGLTEEQEEQFEQNMKKHADVSQERLEEIAAEQEEQSQVIENPEVELTLGAFRLAYFQQRAQVTAQYAAHGYKCPPNHPAFATYIAHCINKAFHEMQLRSVAA